MREMIREVRKRDGRLEGFDASKIESAVNKAHKALHGDPNPALAERIAASTVKKLEDKFGDTIPTVEDVQDAVEGALISEGRADLARAYILYRQRHADMRTAKSALGVTDDLKLTVNAIRILEQRYLKRDDRGKIIETPSQMFRRVAKTAAAPEEKYDGDAQEMEERFFRMLTALDFLPNSPTLMNAGREMGQLSACFVLPVADSMEGIFDAVKNMALIHQSGGGTGFDFSRLRSKGAIVKSTGGQASGPVSFMTVFDHATEVVKQGGRRRGANMAILRVDHPDIIEFITIKTRDPMALRNFNLSVAVTDEFMRAVAEKGDFALKEPHTGETVAVRHARDIFQLICTAAWQCGDPGLVFIDEINRQNPISEVARIESTNPCGEQPLLPWESCNLGSINLNNFTRAEGFDFDKLGESVDLAVRFLDNVIEANRYPLKKVEEATLASRKIGLGVMGFADALYRMDMPYNSDEALYTARELMKFISQRARETSEILGGERGACPLFERSEWSKRGWKHLRNIACTTIAPTGTIGLIAGASSGIEPVFALRYWRRMAEGTVLLETHPIFEHVARQSGFDIEEIFRGCASNGSIGGCDHLPEELRRRFVTAREISPRAHVRMQAAFQEHTDNGVSKTVNLPRDAGIEDVEEIYLLAHELGCKGITIYRQGSREEDLLRAGAPESSEGRLPSCPNDENGPASKCLCP